MKLSVIDNEHSEAIVPLISRYANTQNRLNAADFFSNHPFHIRMEEFSRRIWAPAQQGAQRETKWFYERARGQYGNAQLKLTQAERRRFKAEYPKLQMFTKTDLAKFENTWDDHPKWVNLGAQKNFAHYAQRIGREWDKASREFNEFYYKRAIARALIFRRTEKLVLEQPWYNGGYRANIVAYTIASISTICKRHEKLVDFIRVWDAQALPSSLIHALESSAKFVNEHITQPPQGISNISEWCKKELCWQRIHNQLFVLKEKLPAGFWNDLVSVQEQKRQMKVAVKSRIIEDGIAVQTKVLEVPTDKWRLILEEGTKKDILTPKQIDILRIAMQIPAKIPTEKQCTVLIDVLQKAQQEGLSVRNA